MDHPSASDYGGILCIPFLYMRTSCFVIAPSMDPSCCGNVSVIKAYRQVEDRVHLGQMLAEYLEDYNMEFPSQMHLVFFADAIAHVSRICRVLRQPRGNALLVGVGGACAPSSWGAVV